MYNYFFFHKIKINKFIYQKIILRNYHKNESVYCEFLNFRNTVNFLENMIKVNSLFENFIPHTRQPKRVDN